ncbi:hypothetical protein B0H14DRAFT_947066 [Mycena olivaceomarginata]|nr:hypothetical protein B0H14DRAFT_947066 [Mycena olivaceomarginata]
MLSPRDLAYSLFGGPLIIAVGPTVNGEIIRVRVQPINTISVSALIISVLLFIGFMYCYLSPLFRQRAARAAACTDAEQPEVQKDEEEKDSLLSWLHVRSRDRFSTAAHDGPIPKPTPRLASTPVMLTPPPPAYASRPKQSIRTQWSRPLRRVSHSLATQLSTRRSGQQPFGVRARARPCSARSHRPWSCIRANASNLACPIRSPPDRVPTAPNSPPQ